MYRKRSFGTYRDPHSVGGLLYMPALAAIRYNPDLCAKYRQLVAEGKPRKVAQVESLGEQVRQLAWQYTQEQKEHAKWIGELGVRVTTLTDAYDSLFENVDRMIEASNRVTRELNELLRRSTPRLSRSGRTGTGRTAWRVSLRAVSKTECAAWILTGSSRESHGACGAVDSPNSACTRRRDMS